MQRAIIKSHCKETLKGPIALSPFKKPLKGAIVNSNNEELLKGALARSNFKEPMQGDDPRWYKLV